MELSGVRCTFHDMKPLLLLAFVSLSIAADLEYITTADGRNFIGYYDAAAGTLTVEGPPKAVLRMPAAQITQRSPYIRVPDADPAKRDAAEVVRLEAEQAAALAEAARLRKFASTRAGKDVEVALAQANEHQSLAQALGAKADALRVRVASARQAATPLAAQPVADGSEPRSRIYKALAEVYALRDEATTKEFEALVEYLGSKDLAEKPLPPLSADPRQSEIEYHKELATENVRRSNLRDALSRAPKSRTHAEREQWSANVMAILEAIPKRSAARDQEEAAERERVKPRKR